MARVLVVDDDETVRMFVRGALEFGRGDDVFTAEDGDAALAMLRGGLDPDVILLDLLMPRMDGNDFLAAIQHTAHPPIIVFSAWLGHLREDLREIPFQIVGKPAPASKICEMVAAALEPDSDL